MHLQCTIYVNGAFKKLQLTLGEEGSLALGGLANLACGVLLAPTAMRPHGLREDHLQ